MKNRQFWNNEAKDEKESKKVIDGLKGIETYDQYKIKPSVYNMSIAREGGPKGGGRNKRQAAKDEKKEAERDAEERRIKRLPTPERL